MNAGINLEALNWMQAEQWLARDLVVIPLGAAAKEHGPHLPLNNDALIAGWLAEEVRRRLPVVVAPSGMTTTGSRASHFSASIQFSSSRLMPAFMILSCLETPAIEIIR